MTELIKFVVIDEAFVRSDEMNARYAKGQGACATDSIQRFRSGSSWNVELLTTL